MKNRLIILIICALAGLAMLAAHAAPSRIPMAKLHPSMQKLQKAKTVPMAKLKAAKGVRHEA